MAEAENKTAPYLPFKSFIGAIEGLAPHVPDIIDRSIWSSQSGAMQSAILGAFRFLGLIDDARRTSASLRRLVESPDTRKQDLAAVLERAYSQVFALNLHKATPKQLDDAITEYNVSGATHQKAVSFFIQAAVYCGIPLSPYISRRKARAVSRKKSARNRVISGDASTEETFSDPEEPASTKSRTVQLRSGGQVTVAMQFDPFTLSAEDREFIFGLIDELSGYERKGDLRPGPTSDVAATVRTPPKAARSTEPDDSFTQGITDEDVPF